MTSKRSVQLEILSRGWSKVGPQVWVEGKRRNRRAGSPVEGRIGSISRGPGSFVSNPAHFSHQFVREVGFVLPQAVVTLAVSRRTARRMRPLLPPPFSPRRR